MQGTLQKWKKNNNLQDISSSGIDLSVSCSFLFYFLFMEKVQSLAAHREPLKKKNLTSREALHKCRMVRVNIQQNTSSFDFTPYISFLT